MYIKKASIQGPCKGVISAIKKINKLLDDSSTQKPIYMLGRIVHNEHIIKAYLSKGIIVLDGDKRNKLIKSITSGTVIITAHGVSDDIYDYLKNNNINYLDCTCEYVNKTKNLIKDKLNSNYKILYLGVKDHPECEGILSLDKNIFLINYKDVISSNYQFSYIFSDSDKIMLTCQTTLSYLDVLEIYNKLKRWLPDLEIAGEVCSATRLRQSALMRECNDYDLCLVVGDKNSNNTKSLKEVCLKYTNTKCVLIESINDLNDLDTNDMKIFITSGASTPKVIVDEIVDCINNTRPYISKIDLDDYIKIK